MFSLSLSCSVKVVRKAVPASATGTASVLVTVPKFAYRYSAHEPIFRYRVLQAAADSPSGTGHSFIPKSDLLRRTI
jgi:hypothetical protein